jgi:hypothetical protein
MPVNETLALERSLREHVGLPVDLVVANGVLPGRFTAAEERAVAALGAENGPVAAALAAHARHRTQQAQLVRLRRGVAAPVVTLPFVFEPELGARALTALSRLLEERAG